MTILSKKQKFLEVIAIAIAILIIGSLTIYFGINKVNYHEDEVWTYGLANNLSGIYPQVEYGVKYSGYGPFADFVTVKSGTEFDYANVLRNQKADVHPPFYYILIHTVCSVFSGKYSKWYGISVNLFWMIFLIILLYRLSKKITGSAVASFGVIFSYGLSVIFMDSMVLIRMYTQFTFFTILMAYHLKNYWKKRFDGKFYGCLAAVLVLGMLTHYYFLIYSFALFIFSAIRLFLEKRYDELKKSLITAFGSALVFSLIWPSFFLHLFLGDRGRQAIHSAIIPKNILTGPLSLLYLCSNEAVGIFAGLFLVLGFVFLILKRKNRIYEKIPEFETVLALTFVFYIIVVGTIAPFINVRYTMPLAWIFILLLYLSIRALIIKNIRHGFAEYIVAIIFLIINICNYIHFGGFVPNDYHYDGLIDVMNSIEGKSVAVYIDKEWKRVLFFEELRHAKDYVFIKEGAAKSTSESDNAEYDYLLVCAASADEEVLLENYKPELIYAYSGRRYYHLLEKRAGE